MKWIYGKQDWKTFERGLENCYLLTNGLGGFSSLTMTGAAARNDHAVLMACTKAPNCRYNVIHRISERLNTKDGEYVLSSQEFADGSRENGWRYLSEFCYEDTAFWKYQVNGIEIEKELSMKQNENTISLIYRIKNRSRKNAKLTVTPFFQFASKGQDLEETLTLIRKGNQISDGIMCCQIQTNGEIRDISERVEQYYYRYDVCDGRRAKGSAKACCAIETDVPVGKQKKLALICSLNLKEQEAAFSEKTTDDFTVKKQERDQRKITGADQKTELAEAILTEAEKYRNQLADQAGLCSEIAKTLVKSADQFVSERESTCNKTILAGYPFFEDWGRDTMIALPGICLSTGRYKTARSILRTFAKCEKDGLMPNLFPEGGKKPLYNTVDAALLFINCVWLYYEKTKDTAFVREMYPVMERIIQGYRNGTDFNIHMDDDGLICAGSGLDQVTWMDVRAGEILPTPRHGKPVEINAYWYNALRIMAELSKEKYAAETQMKSTQYEKLAQKVKTEFANQFWMEEKQCLRDVLSGTAVDEQIRCNQIWAVSMPFTMLEREQEKAVVDTVFEKLYTPYGLRTLAMEDPQFHPVYAGEMMERDLAYHQGTVWVFPLGAYYLAYLKVHDFSRESAETVKGQLEVMESAMREGCIGQLPEIYDGENPVSSKGCFAQAWSVGEILRVYDKLEKLTRETKPTV